MPFEQMHNRVAKDLKKANTMIKEQLEQYYESLRQDKVNRINTRKWCLTLWIAVLGLIGSKKIELNFIQEFILIYSPIIIFWVLEAFQQSFSYRNALKVKELEAKMHNKEKIEIHDYYINFRLGVPLKVKISDFIMTTFTSEVLIFFYMILIIGSTIFYLALK